MERISEWMEVRRHQPSSPNANPVVCATSNQVPARAGGHGICSVAWQPEEPVRNILLLGAGVCVLSVSAMAWTAAQ